MLKLLPRPQRRIYPDGEIHLLRHLPIISQAGGNRVLWFTGLASKENYLQNPLPTKNSYKSGIYTFNMVCVYKDRLVVCYSEERFQPWQEPW